MSYQAEAVFALGADYVRLRVLGGHRRGGGVRGPVRGFSRGSRRRLLDKVNQIDRRCVEGGGLFVTLTYPGEFSESWRVWKAHLRSIEERLKRRFPGVQLLWRLEFQKRGAPHFHFLVFNVERIDISWLSQAWYEVVGSGDPRHQAAGTEISRVRSWRGVLFYVGKYMAKTDSVDFATGRVWGVIGGLPITLVKIELGLRELYQVRRVLRGWLGRRLGRRVTWARARGQGIKVYLPSSVFVALVMQF